GQGISLLEMQDLARQLGANVTLWSAPLVCLVVAVVAGAVFLGRWLRPRLSRDRLTMFAPSWAALGLALALILACAWLAGRSSAQPSRPTESAASSPRPNLIMIVMDTVRADHLSMYGYERDTTPNLK